MDAVEAGWAGPVERVDLIPDAPSVDAASPRADGSVSVAMIARFTGRALKTARTLRPDIVVCGLLGLLPVAATVARMFRAKLALVAYGLEVWGPLRPLDLVLVRRCTYLLCVSRFTADVLGRRAGVGPERMQTLALPMSEPIAAGAQGAVADHGGRRPLVLTVSRLASEHRYKGHFDIARCFARVLERQPNATWVVVGDGDDLPSLRAECDRLGLQDAVTFRGRVSDNELIELYRTAAVFALPSFADTDADPPVGEGFGLVYMEAGAFGVPVIAATPGGGSADFVIDGETGLTVRPHAPEELAGAILRLLGDPDLRTALGERARARAFARHLPVHFSEALHRSLA